MRAFFRIGGATFCLCVGIVACGVMLRNVVAINITVTLYNYLKAHLYVLSEFSIIKLPCGIPHGP